MLSYPLLAYRVLELDSGVEDGEFFTQQPVDFASQQWPALWRICARQVDCQAGLSAGNGPNVQLVDIENAIDTQEYFLNVVNAQAFWYSFKKHVDTFLEQGPGSWEYPKSDCHGNDGVNPAPAG